MLYFPLLWEAWLEATRTYRSTDLIANRAHHNLMAEQYVTDIAEALRTWDTRNHGNLDVTLEDYKAVAWEGLIDSYAWEQKTETERKAINDRRARFLQLYGYFQ